MTDREHPQRDTKAPEPSHDERPKHVGVSRRQFVFRAAKKAAYVAPVVATLAASRTAFATGSGVS